MHIDRCLHHTILAIMLIVIVDASYYDVLGIKRSATDREIRRAFRQLALKYHPDKNPDESAVGKFREIVAAYECLGDAERRKHYDSFGSDQGEKQQQQEGPGFDYDEFFKQFDESMREHLKRHKEAHERAHQWAHRQATGMKMNLFDGLWDDDDMDFIGTDGMPEFGHLDSMFGGGGDLHEFVNREGVHIETKTTHCHTITQRIGDVETTRTTCT